MRPYARLYGLGLVFSLVVASPCRGAQTSGDPSCSAGATVDPIEARIAAADRENDAAWRRLKTQEQFAAKRDAFRAALRKALGFDGIVRSPLNARVLGRKDYGAFRVEKVLLESAPGAYVTALAFLPDATRFAPPYAGFLFIPGHADEGKGSSAYLQTCELGARHGLASVIYDPVGQGERAQGAGIRNADEHVRLGAYAALLGETTATVMMRDAVRVFDYFESRPDIDRTRLGVSGNSGGGTLASYFMAADGRVRAAAPSCYLSSVREHVLSCGPQDAEQQFAGELAWGFNHAGLVFAAKCPVLVNAAVDDFFQIEGGRATHRLVRSVASEVGLSADWFAISEAPGPHGMSRTHREAAVRFFLRHLRGEEREVVERETTTFVRADHTVTPDGEVARLPGFVSAYDTYAERFVKEGVSVERAAARAKPLVLREQAGGDSRFAVDTLRGHVEKGRRSVLRLGGEPANGEVAATLFADGARLLGRTFRKGKVSYYERRKDDEVVAVDLYIEGRSLLALRAAEVLNLTDELHRRTGLRPALVAEGRWTAVAMFARAADPAAFADVRLINPPKSYLESLKTRDYLSFADISL